MGFRLAARHFFLTYPQCPIPQDTALDQLKEKGTIENYIVAQEDHQDGHKHIPEDGSQEELHINEMLRPAI